jgi:hypothetical protein
MILCDKKWRKLERSSTSLKIFGKFNSNAIKFGSITNKIFHFTGYIFIEFRLCNI